MNETQKVLRQLGWSDDLIEAFTKADEIGDEMEQVLNFHVSPQCIDLSDVTVDLQEPLIEAGTAVRVTR